MSILDVRYIQSFVGQGGGEIPQLELVITKEAITSGFFARMQSREAGSAYLVLSALALHTRPLRGAELATLQQLGLATAEDEGRLFCWVTRQGLAAALDTKWETVERAVNWLVGEGVVREMPMPAAFAAQFVKMPARGKANSAVLYILQVEGLLRTQWGASVAQPNTPPDEMNLSASSVSDLGVQSRATVSVEGVQSDPTVSVERRQSFKDHDHDHDDHRAREISTWTPQIQAAWQTALRSELAPENAHLLAEMIVGGETHLPVIQGMLYLLAQRAAGNPPETQFALLVGVLTGKTSLDWGATPAPANDAELPAAKAPATSPDGLPATPPAPPLVPGGDPVLAQVARWYESEIGPLSPLIADEIRERTAQWRDLAAWKGAFTKAGPIKGKQANHWAYVLACMEGTDGQFKLDRKPKNPPAAQNHGGNGGGDRRANSSAPATDRRHSGGKRARPRVIQSTPEERAASEAAADPAALDAEYDRIVAELAAEGLTADGAPIPGGPADVGR